MKNIIVLVVFLVGIAGLIFWLWSDKDSTTKDFNTLATETATTPRPVNQNPALNEVEISVDDEGLIIDRLYGKQLDILVTRNEVKDVAVLDGIMTFSELEDGNWNFKAINLAQYIESYLQ